MKKKLLQYGISTAVGALISVWVMYIENLFGVEGYPAETVFTILADAFFVSGILLALFGALLWIATTGFFDGVSFAFRSAAHLFLPFLHLEKKSFYDYKTEKAGKRAPAQFFLLIVGAGYLTLSGIFLILWATA